MPVMTMEVPSVASSPNDFAGDSYTRSRCVGILQLTIFLVVTGVVVAAIIAIAFAEVFQLAAGQ
jgi:hypothetical protein